MIKSDYLINEIAEFQFSDRYLGLTKGGGLSNQRKLQRVEHLQEEISELKQAMEANNLHEVVDALGDAYYIAMGAMLESGEGGEDTPGMIQEYLELTRIATPSNTEGFNTTKLVGHPVFACITTSGFEKLGRSELYFALAKLCNQCLNAMRFLGVASPIGVIAEIHRANLDRVPGVSKRGHKGDMVKPEGWRGPNLWSAIIGSKTKEEDIIQSRRALYGSFGDRAEFVNDVVKAAEKYQGYMKLDAPSKHALHMIIEKIGRIAVSPKPNYKDNWVDISGYAKLAIEEIELKEKGNE